MPDLTRQTFYECDSLRHTDFYVASDSNPDKIYKITVRDGLVFCTCPGYIHYRKCKHTRRYHENKRLCGWQQFINGGRAGGGRTRDQALP